MSDPQELDLGLPRTEVTTGLDADITRIFGALLADLSSKDLDEVISAMDRLEGNLTTPAGEQLCARIRLRCYRILREDWTDRQ